MHLMGSCCENEELLFIYHIYFCMTQYSSDWMNEVSGKRGRENMSPSPGYFAHVGFWASGAEGVNVY